MITTSAVDNIQNFTRKDSGSAADKAQNALNGDFENFLKLLTTQLKNQDPTQPLDTNDFTQQVATLSGVEQQINTNKTLGQTIDKLSALVGSSQMNTAVSYIGKNIQAEGNKGVLSQGQSTFVYDLAAAAETVDVTITDAQGNTVFSGQGSKNAGHNVVTWDGVNSVTGQQMPDGTYTIAVKAKDASNNEVKATTYTYGYVQAVEMKDGGPVLSLGDFTVPLDKVTSIQQVQYFSLPPDNPPTSGTSGNTTTGTTTTTTTTNNTTPPATTGSGT